MIPNDINNSPECRNSLRRFIQKYLRADIAKEDRKFVEILLDLLIQVSSGEFICAACQKSHKLYGICIQK